MFRMPYDEQTVPINALEALAAKEAMQQADLRAILRPLYEAHQQHQRHTVGCVFCEGVVT